MLNADFMARLERVKQSRKWSWEKTAEAMDLSRSMIQFISKGKYSVSEKAAKRLRQVEAEAGISPGAKAVIEAISRAAAELKPRISKADLKAGHANVEVKFVSGESPLGEQNLIRLSRPDVKARAKLVAEILAEESYHPVLLACLPSDLAKDSFLNLLHPLSYNALTETAMTLVFGPDWEKDISGLAQ
jgi:transcriptional regulator with XRE-family HTH domain